MRLKSLLKNFAVSLEKESENCDCNFRLGERQLV